MQIKYLYVQFSSTVLFSVTKALLTGNACVVAVFVFLTKMRTAQRLSCFYCQLEEVCHSSVQNKSSHVTPQSAAHSLNSHSADGGVSH